MKEPQIWTMFQFMGNCSYKLLVMFVWLFTLYVCSSELTVKGENQKNLAWELIKGFAKIWNHTDQGICITLPESTEQGLRFFMIPLNLSFVFNMTSVTAPLPLSEQWTNKTNGAQILWKGIPIVHDLYQTYIPPPNITLDWLSHSKYCKTNRPEVNVTILSQIESPHPSIKSSKGEFKPGIITFEEYNARQPCLVYSWDPLFDPLYMPDVYESKYSTVFSPSWCVQLPNITNITPIDRKNLMWAWSVQQFLKSKFKEPKFTVPQVEDSPLFNCSKVITCKEGPGDPPETWFMLRIRTLIRDMCTCWRYPSKGWKNQDESCNSTYKYLLNHCGVPYTHYPIHGTPINTKPKITILDHVDNTDCETAKYIAPLGMAWGCSDGKFYSHLSLQQHAGLKCGPGIPSLCPRRVFTFAKVFKERHQRSVIPSPKATQRPQWAIKGIDFPDYYTTGQKASLFLENFFAPYVTLKRHQFILEDITWQLSVLSNWTQHAFGELNTQVQQTSKMTLQNRLALDTLLLKEQGVCGMLNLSETECCITIYNASTSIEEARTTMREISNHTRNLFYAMQPHEVFSESWVTNILDSFGLTGWGKWIIQIGIAIVIGIVFLIIGIGLVKCMINRLLISFSPSVRYIHITTTEESYIDVPKNNVESSGWNM